MKISFLASHGGSATKHIIEAIRSNNLKAQIGIVITNNPDSSIFHWCLENEIEVTYISGKTHPSEEDKDKAICRTLNQAETELIILSGYMKKIGPQTLNNYSNKILNIHPSLLPKHGGRGLYGDKVHQSVINSGDKQSGATVHFINKEYDEGPIISQQIVKLSKNETIESLKKKVQSIEGELYLNSVNKIIEHTLLSGLLTPT